MDSFRPLANRLVVRRGWRESLWCGRQFPFRSFGRAKSVHGGARSERSCYAGWFCFSWPRGWCEGFLLCRGYSWCRTPRSVWRLRRACLVCIAGIATGGSGIFIFFLAARFVHRLRYSDNEQIKHKHRQLFAERMLDGRESGGRQQENERQPEAPAAVEPKVEGGGRVEGDGLFAQGDFGMYDDRDQCAKEPKSRGNQNPLANPSPSGPLGCRPCFGRP